MSFRRWAAVFGLLFYTTELMQRLVDDDDELRRALQSYCRVMKMSCNFSKKQWDYSVPDGSFTLAQIAKVVHLRWLTRYRLLRPPLMAVTPSSQTLLLLVDPGSLSRATARP